MKKPFNPPNPFTSHPNSPPIYKGFNRTSGYITLRDGIQLAVDIYLPKGLPRGARLPTLLEQTRYWRRAELRPPVKWFLRSTDDLHPIMRYMKPYFINRGYAMVVVDVRGTGASYGVWQRPWDPASVEDAREIVDWIIAQPWSNGSVGGMGISYAGTTAELLLAIEHPAVKAILPMYNHPDVYADIAFPGGAANFRMLDEWLKLGNLLDQNILPTKNGFVSRFMLKGVAPVDGRSGRASLIEAVRMHATNGRFDIRQGVTYRDEYVPDLHGCTDDVAVRHFAPNPSENSPAVFGWASWMDAGTADSAIKRFLSYPNAQRLVVGAWCHGGIFQASPYQTPDAPLQPHPFDQWAEAVRFFDATLKGLDNGVKEERIFYYYTLGAEAWRQTDTWPPAGVKMQRWFFGPEHALTMKAPGEANDSDAYVVDFSASTGKQNRWFALGPALNQSIVYPDRADQAAHLLTYTSPTLERDTEISGYPVIHLFAGSTEPDVVFYVYLEDVAPDGKVYYLTEGQLRSLQRKLSDVPPGYPNQTPYHSFRQADALPLVPGEIAPLSFSLLPISALVRRGHRLRVSIAGHDAGEFQRIPSQGTPVFTFARSASLPSNIDLPVKDAV